jgi:uncharacterized coiled-coil protein SlyX
MSDNIENIVLEHLKRFQVGQDRIELKLDEVTRRLSNLEAGQASILQHIGHLSSVDAQLQLASDATNRRLERIEKRLELTS